MDDFDKIIDGDIATTGGLTAQGRTDLRVAGGWAMFLAILGFLGAGIMILSGIAMFFIAAIDGSGNDFGGMAGFMSGGVLGGFYILLALLYLVPSLFLFRFANNARKAGASGDSGSVGDALANLRRYFMALGIMIISLVVLYIIGIVVAMVAFASVLPGAF